jgi:iron complex outermembrane recepter protein
VHTTRYRIRFWTIALCAVAAFWCAEACAQALIHFDLPAQLLARSLEAIGAATNTDVGFDANQLAGLMAPAIKADLTLDGALVRVLAGTGLRPRHLGGHTIVIARTYTISGSAQNPRSPIVVAGLGESSESTGSGDAGEALPPSGAMQSTPGPNSDTGNSTQPSDQASDNELQEVIVTGSHIRGEEPVGSELKVYTREDLDQSGAATVDQFARLIPQNFSNTDGVSNYVSNAFLASFSNAAENIANSSAFNIHGLGPSATLTLVNGHRMAPAGFDGSLVDVSLIPLSAVDHIDILSDGASAIYGSDAVAGVVNIVTRKDFDGAESGIRFGEATDGGAREVTASQVLGKSWGTGNALLTYEYDDQGGLDASQRSYIAAQGGPYSLLPESHRDSVFLTGYQMVGTDTTLSGQATYSDRATSSVTTYASTLSTALNTYAADEKQYGLTLSVDQLLVRDWHVSLTGDFSELRQAWDENMTTASPGTPRQNSVNFIDGESQLLEADASANGSLFSLPAGPVKAAVGADFRREHFGADTFPGIDTGSPTEHRNVSSTFLEMVAPIATGVGPGLQRLEASGAVRNDDYSDFGSSTNFKFGSAWTPVTGLTLKSTFGTSFQAPLLSQLHSPVFSYAYQFPDPSSSTGVTDTLYKIGGNSNLEAEKSRALTLGLEWKPVQNFQLSANYFRIDFEDRIEAPPTINLDIFTGLLAPFIERNPPLAEVQAAFDSPYFIGDLAGLGPAGVKAVFDDETANISSTHESGIDFATAYKLSTRLGQFAVSADLTHLIRNDLQTIGGAPVDALLNAFGQPPKWKGRGGLTWAQGPLIASAFVNFVGGYENTLLTPGQPISAWTTADLYLAYKTRNMAPSPSLDNLTVALNVSNLADKRPPYVLIPPSDLSPGQNPIPFDPANASPVGRVVTIQLTKGWGLPRSSNSSTSNGASK